MGFLDLEGLKVVASALAQRFGIHETRIEEIDTSATNAEELSKNVDTTLGAHLSDKVAHTPFLTFTEILEDAGSAPAIPGSVKDAPAPDIIYDQSSSLFKKRSYVRHPTQSGYLKAVFATGEDTKYYNDDDQFAARTGILFMDSKLRLYTFTGTLERVNTAL